MRNVIKQMIVPFCLELCILIITAWLFFDFSLISFLLFLYFPFALKKQWKEKQQQKKWELNLAFKDAIACLSNSLAVGYSSENSLKEVVKELEQLYGAEAEICLEFRKMVKQIELGSNIEQVFLEFGKQSGVEDIRQLAEIFSIVKRTGGNLGQVLKKTESVLQDKIELKRELNVAIAEKKLEFQVMCFVPYGILFYLKVCASTLSQSLYHTTFGTLFMCIILVLYFCLRMLGERMIQGEIQNNNS